MLTIEGLVVGYGAVQVLHGIDLQVERGEIVALIGANGAGKTTLLRAISGLLKPSAGKVVFDGDDVTRMPPSRIVQRGLVHCPEGRMVLARMTVRENLLLGAYCRENDPAIANDLAQVLALFPRLSERIAQLAGTLSGGEQQMLAIARSLMGKPRLLMLDEPSLGLAPLMVESIFGAITHISAQGITVLLIEQNANRALETAHRAYALELGRVTIEGPAAAVRADERVRQAYLGI